MYGTHLLDCVHKTGWVNLQFSEFLYTLPDVLVEGLLPPNEVVVHSAVVTV